MVEITTRPLQSKWKNLTANKWKGASGTWKLNGYATEYVISVTESFGLADARNMTTSLVCPESLHVASTYWDNISYMMRVLERITVAEVNSNDLCINNKESLAIEDRLLPRLFIKVLSDEVTFKELCSKNKLSRLYDAVAIADSNSNTPCVNNKESLGVEDKLLPRLYVKTLPRSITFKELCSKNKLSRLYDIVGITDKKDVHPNIVSKDSFSIQEHRTINANLLMLELLKVADKYTDKRVMYRWFYETAKITDKRCLNLTKLEKQQFKVICELMENSNAVISDIVISTSDIITDVPAGYGAWKPFVSGDYTYKDALIKAVLQSFTLDYNALLSEYKVFVDLPDIQDHAVTNVPAEKTYIPFNLEFYQIPEVTITATGSTKVLIPHIVEVTLEGFYVELRDTNNSLTAGKISWQALGC